MVSYNPYTVLQVKATASLAEIKAAYKKLAFRHHPDRNQGSQLHTEHFKQIAEAYKLLSDPDRRAHVDRQLAHTFPHRPPVRQSPAPSRPYPYGGNFANDAFGSQGAAPPPSEQTFTGKGGRRYSYATPHQIFIAITLLGCLAMGSLWLGSIMGRYAAKDSLSKGDYASALEYDSTYGEAWFYRGSLEEMMGHHEAALSDMSHGIILAEEVPARWHWQRGRAAEYVGQDRLASSSYFAALRLNPENKQDGLSYALRDSAYIRLAGLLFYRRNQPDSTYQLLSRASQKTRSMPSMLFLRGAAACKTGRYTEAVYTLQAAADAGYEPGNSYFFLGNALLATADTTSACKAWDTALTSGYVAADSLLRRYCTFAALRPAGPLTVHVESGSEN